MDIDVIGPRYPLQEFLDDEKAIQRGLDEFADADEPYFAMLNVVAAHMKVRYESMAERIYRMQHLTTVMRYISQHIAAFDQSDFAVFGSQNVGALVGEHLMQAVHELALERGIGNLDAVTPGEVMELAAAYQE